MSKSTTAASVLSHWAGTPQEQVALMSVYLTVRPALRTKNFAEFLQAVEATGPARDINQAIVGGMMTLALTDEKMVAMLATYVDAVDNGGTNSVATFFQQAISPPATPPAPVPPMQPVATGAPPPVDPVQPPPTTQPEPSPKKRKTKGDCTYKPGDRLVYKGDKLTVAGSVLAIEGGLVRFKGDDGTEYTNLDPKQLSPEDGAVESTISTIEHIVELTEDQATKIESWLATKRPVDGQAVGAELLAVATVPCTGATVIVNIVNGEQGPYVDVYMCDDTQIVAEAVPQTTLEAVFVTHGDATHKVVFKLPAKPASRRRRTT